MAAVLVLSSIGLWQLGLVVESRLPEKSEGASPQKPGLGTTAADHAATRSPRAAQAAAPAVRLEEPLPTAKDIQDRFKDQPVLQVRETVQPAGTEQQVKRIKIIRSTSFKYPLLRVEEELVRGPKGDRLIRQKAMVADHVLVRPEANVSADTLVSQLKDAGASLRKTMPASGLLLIAFDNPGLDTAPQMAARLSGMKNFVRYAEPDYIVHGNATLPNETAFARQWDMHNTGQDGGLNDADIDAPEAWAVTTGSRNVRVAILDTGMEMEHADLKANVWTNPNEIPNNGIDDDGNGLVDDVHGWDFYNNDARPDDDQGHGTHCAGIIGATGNNTAGVAGVAWNVSLIPLKILGSNSQGDVADAIEAIAYATKLGVHFTSNSWTTLDYSEGLKTVVDAAGAAGILCIAAAGNSGSQTNLYPEYPACLPGAHVISVVSTDRNDRMAGDSNYGAVATDLGAPGVDVYSTYRFGGYQNMSGTSMACPHVTGACVLIKSYQPALTPLQIREVLLRSVDPVPALAGKTASGGRLNVHKALRASEDILISPSDGLLATGPFGGPMDPAFKALSLANFTSAALSWSATVNQSWVTLSATGGSLNVNENSTLTVTLNEGVKTLRAGNHFATLTVLNVTSGRSHTLPIAVQIHSTPVYENNLDSDPGWARNGEWAFGVPAGGGGLTAGKPDPKSGSTGQNVFGINLAGNYSTQVKPAQYLTAGPFDLKGFKDTRLRFQRWLNTDLPPWVRATVEVSIDGSMWHSVWQNPASQTAESSWTRIEHNLASIADGQSQVYVRWGHHVTEANAIAFSGWNLDDIQIIATPEQQMLLTLPESVSEGGPPGQAEITLTPAPLTDLTITFTSNDAGLQLVVPANLTVPAGQERVTFPISAVQDILADGSQNVTVWATAQGYPNSSSTTVVNDDDPGELTLVLPASLAEGSGDVVGQASVSISTPAPVDISIGLESSDVSEVTVPSRVTIPQGSTTVSFILNVPEDSILDGDQQVAITASVFNWPAISRAMVITDNEPRNISVHLPSMRLESSGLMSDEGSLELGGVAARPITLYLSSSNITALTVPVFVVVPTGASTARFDLQFHDNSDTTGDKTVAVSAHSEGFISGDASMLVADDEMPALPALPTPQDGQNPTSPKTALSWQYLPQSGAPPESYDVYFRAGNELETFLGNTASAVWTLPPPGLPANTVYRWRVVSRKGNAIREGPVWTFTSADVGALHHFSWDPVFPTVGKEVPVGVRVNARDENENQVTAYTGRSLLKAVIPQPERFTGTGTYPWFFPFCSSYKDVRTQSIYPPSETGPAGRLTSLALDVTVPPNQPLENFTIRLKHTAKAEYAGANALWESEGWITVFSGELNIRAAGWVEIIFSTPFDYDGTSHLMVDFSFNNDSYSQDGITRTTITGAQNRSLVFRADNTYGDPLGWAGTLPAPFPANGVPNLRLRRASKEIPMTPGVSDHFIQGSWSGEVSFLAESTGVHLQASAETDAQVTGLSTAIQVVKTEELTLLPEPPFTGGLVNRIQGTPLPAAHDYEIQRAGKPDFSDSISSGILAAPHYVFNGLDDGRLYHYRGRVRTNGAWGKWSGVERSAQDASPPNITFGMNPGGITAGTRLSLAGTGSDATSGIGSLTFNGSPAITASAFTAWNAPELSLQEGLNTFSIVVTDQAVPPNSRELSWSITRLATPADDANGNGIADLLEYAFNASGSHPGASLPTLSIGVHPETHQKHLVLTYRRLIDNPSQLTYEVETSTSPTDWKPLETTPEVISAENNTDGVTQLVKVRLYPPIEGTARRFARLKVQTVP